MDRLLEEFRQGSRRLVRAGARGVRYPASLRAKATCYARRAQGT